MNVIGRCARRDIASRFPRRLSGTVMHASLRCCHKRIVGGSQTVYGQTRRRKFLRRNIDAKHWVPAVWNITSPGLKKLSVLPEILRYEPAPVDDRRIERSLGLLIRMVEPLQYGSKRRRG